MNAQPYIDRMVKAMRLKHLALKTEDAYAGWARRFAAWLPRQQALRDASSEKKVEAFLTALAQDRVSASTQNQAFNALLYFYRHGLHKPLADGIKALRAKRPQRIRTAPHPDTLTKVLGVVRDVQGYPTRLLCHLLYGCGLRVSEGVSLRVRDVRIKDA